MNFDREATITVREHDKRVKTVADKYDEAIDKLTRDYKRRVTEVRAMDAAMWAFIGACVTGALLVAFVL